MADQEQERVVSRKKKYEPTDDDYKLSGFDVEEAENGVVITCKYALDDAVKAKMQQHPDMKYIPYEIERKTVRNVFEDMKDAKKFCEGELDKLWAARTETEIDEEDDE